MMEFILMFVLFMNLGKLMTSPIDIFPGYIFVLITLPFLLLKLKAIKKRVLLLLLIVTISGVFNILFGRNSFTNFLKIYTSILVFTVFYWGVFKHFQMNVLRIFNIYMLGAFIVSFIGVFQVVSHMIGFTYGYDYSWIPLEGVRSYGGDTSGLFGLYIVHSLYGEPAHFAHGMAPAYFSAIFNLAHRVNSNLSKTQNSIILLAAVLSSSFIAYLIISISVLFVVLKYNSKRIRLLFSLCASLTLYFVGVSNERVLERIGVLSEMISGNSVLDITQTNIAGGLLILINNAQVAIQSFTSSPIFGSGLGSHKYSYLKFSELAHGSDEYLMNYNDAGSLLLRICSELGTFGLVLVIIVLYKYRNRSYQDNRDLWLINTGAYLMILSYLIRQGHYFAYGLPLFVILYIYSSNEKFKVRTHLY